MKEINFKKGIEELKQIRLTQAEKSRMLERIFATPVPSPFFIGWPAFAYVRRARVLVATLLIFVTSFGSVVYASGSSLPGDVLYPVKVNVVEPVRGLVKISPEEKLKWQEERVADRIVEAEELASQGRLDDENLGKLERNIKKNSEKFIETTRSIDEDRAVGIRQEFRKRFEDAEAEVEVEIEIEDDRGDGRREQDNSREEDDKDNRGRSENSQRDKVKKLRSAVIQVIDNDDINSSGRNRRGR